MVRLEFVVAAGLAAAFAAGCVRPEASDAQLSLAATWGPFEADPLPHLLVTIANSGGSPADVGPEGMELVVRGPTGMVLLDWGGVAARAIMPGEQVTVALHPRLFADGRLGLAIDHGYGTPAALPAGPYEACILFLCDRAPLGEEETG